MMHRQGQEDERLDLLDVVRVAGDERRRAEVVDLDLGEALDLAEDRAAHVAPEAHRRLRAPVDREDRGDAQDRVTTSMNAPVRTM